MSDDVVLVHPNLKLSAPWLTSGMAVEARASCFGRDKQDALAVGGGRGGQGGAGVRVAADPCSWCNVLLTYKNLFEFLFRTNIYEKTETLVQLKEVFHH